VEGLFKGFLSVMKCIVYKGWVFLLAKLKKKIFTQKNEVWVQMDTFLQKKRRKMLIGGVKGLNLLVE